MDKHFTIITPTLGRRTLLDTIESIRVQKYSNYTHIVVVDGAHMGSYQLAHMPKSDKNLKVVYMGKRYRDFGNSLRRKGWELRPTHTDYITYIDDDDTHINNSLHVLNEELIKLTYDPEFVLFPCERFGQYFMNIPAGSCKTVSCQYLHKPIANNGTEIKFAENKEPTYISDSEWIGEMWDRHQWHILNNVPCLTKVDVSNGGRDIDEK